MRHLLWIVLIVCVLVMPTSAQDDDENGEYRLREVSVEEYLRMMPTVMNYDSRYIDRTVRYELDQFGDLSNMPFDALYDAYRVLDPVSFLNENFDQWPQWLIFSWLRDTDADLSDSDQITFRDYSISIIASDFDANNQDEWVFVINSDLYQSFWVIAEDDSSPSGYRRIDAPTPSFSINCPAQTGCGGSGILVDIEDVNVDGRPELLISSGNCGYGICGVTLDILTWRDGSMIDLTSDLSTQRPFVEVVSGGGGAPSSPPDGTWTFQNIDNDEALELLQNETINGSMDCVFYTTRVFDWSPNEYRYIASSEEIRYEDSLGCALRLGHLALKEGDYETAVISLEHVQQEINTVNESEFSQYVRLRLALAYALNEQVGQAIALLDELVTESPATVLMSTMIQTAYDAYNGTNNAVVICASLYQSIKEFDVWANDESQIMQFGQINDYSIPMTYGGGDFSPANTGCNLPELLMRHAFMLEAGTELPITQLQALGWQIEHSFSADLNDDSVDEWMIWIDVLNNQALLLVTNGLNYVPSMRRYQVPNDQIMYDMHTIAPTDAHLLVQLENVINNRCFNPENARTASFFRLEDNHLSIVRRYHLCDRLTLDEIFANDSQSFMAWSSVYENDCSSDSFSEIHFVWEADTQMFVNPEPQPCPEIRYIDGLEDNWFTCGIANREFCGFYLDAENAFIAIEAIIAEQPDFTDEDFIFSVRYWRALALEALDRPDEALAEYLALVESAPESAWGMLAALHITEAQ